MADEAQQNVEAQQSADPKESMSTPRNSFVSKDEQALQDASAAMQADETIPASPEQPTTAPLKPKKSKKKLLVVLLVVVLLTAVGFGISKLLGKKDASDASATSQSDSGTAKPGADTSQSIEPDSVLYAFKDADANPFTLYTRPAVGGDRKESLKLNRDVYVLQHDTRGSNAAFATDDGLYVSRDNGKNYTNVLKLEAGEQVTGVRFANSGARLVYATTKDLKTSSIKSVNLQGKDTQDVATVDAGGVLLYGWNDQKNKLFYSKGCANCDGSPSSYVIYDTKAKKETEVKLAIAATDYVQGVAISDDFTRILAVNATPDTSGETALAAGVAPYTIVSYDVAAGKATEAATVGEKGEKNPNGTLKVRTLMVGFFAGENKGYYTNDTSLYALKSGTEPSVYYTADKPLLQVLFVNSNVVIAGAGDNTGDYALAHYDVAKKKSSAIFQGDNNTVIIGVTTK